MSSFKRKIEVCVLPEFHNKTDGHDKVHNSGDGKTAVGKSMVEGIGA